jgi:aldose 1-epimerase
MMNSAVSPLIVAAAACVPAAAIGAPESAQRETVAQAPDGQAIEKITLKNAHGLEAGIITWGATLVRMTAPDRAGKFADVTLGFDDAARYLQPHPFFGSIAGRYANRIAKGRFTLDGRTFTLATNNGANHLHGGLKGFDKRVWKAEAAGSNAVRFSYTSPDGEEGYPGTLTASVTYTLTDKNELRLDYEARTDQPTVLNLTNHAYWNLAGIGDVLAHELRLHAARFTAVDEGLIPTGEIRPVAGTPLDFTAAKPVGRDIAPLKEKGQPLGFDHNFVIDHAQAGELALAAELHEPASGRTMRVFTTEPGVQIYTGNHLKDVAGKGGATYQQHAGICLETQHFPDSPNQPEFPTTTLRPGEVFRSTTVYEFTVR